MPAVALWLDAPRSHTRDCIRACTKSAIQDMAPRLNKETCDACGDCVSACAFGAWQLVGRSVAILDLANEAAQDRPFFDASGGGVTLSGGEPTAQMEGMGALAACLKERQISVGLQTCGAFSWDAFQPHVDRFDFIHFDLKLIDAAQHRLFTGADNRVILANARRLACDGRPVVFRSPIIPTVNDSADHVDALAAFLREVGARSIHLLEYHSMGEKKRAAVDAPLVPIDVPHKHAKERVRAARRTLVDAGFEVTGGFDS